MCLLNLVKSIFPALGIIELLAEAQQLTMAGKSEQVLTLLERQAGLQKEDYRNRERLGEKLNRWLEKLPEEFAVTYVAMLAGALGMVRRHPDGLLVLEAYLDLAPEDYRDEERLASKLNARLGDLQEDLQFSILSNHIGALSVLGRESEGMALLRADLGLGTAPQPATGAEREEFLRRFEDRVSQRLGGLMPDTAAAYLSLLVTSLDALGVGNDGVRALESFLDLEPDDYEDNERLNDKLLPWLESLQSPVTGVMALVPLAALLEEAGEGARALSLLEWFMGIERADYRRPDDLERKWQAFKNSYPPDVGATVWRVWGGTLAANGRSDDALALIEVDSGLRADDFASTERLAAKLRSRLQSLQVDTQAAYIFSLSGDLSALGQADRARMIVDWYLRDYENLWRIPEAGDPGVRHVIPLLQRWFEEQAGADADFTWRLCEQSVLYLRRSLLLSDRVRLEDRREFIGYVDGLRRQILQAGHFLIAGENGPQVKERRLQTQLWDAELGQRLLFEKFLMARDEEIERAEAPVDGWPLPGVAEPDYESHLPDPQECDEDAMRHLLGRGARAQRRAPSKSDAHDVKPEEPARPPDVWLNEAESVIRRGVTRELLAETLGANTLLLRAGFRADGALVWTALASDGRDLEIAAAGVGESNEHFRLHWACFRHDLGLLMASSLWDRQAHERLAQVLSDALAAVIQALNRARTPDGVDREWEKVIGQALAVCDSTKSSVAWNARLGTSLKKRLLPLPDPAVFSVWYELVEAELKKLQAHVARHLDALARGETLSDFEEIDEVTRAYLAEVAEIWPLGALAEKITPATDLIFQLEDSLQAIPIAHYPFPDGEPLYAKARSTRVSFSTLMAILQKKTEEQFGVSAERMLVVSYFDNEDEDSPFDDGDEGAAGYAKWLHHGQRRLARQYNLTCLNAGEKPPGAAGAVRAALDEYRAFQTVTVCGHGDPHEAGIKLAGKDVWRGEGCEWSGVDFLLLASCSVGRLEQAGDQDVEGLCVQLALRRARALLACRWPVIAPQAIAFANEVVAQYLALRRQAEAGQTGKENLRARAVNLARHRFLGGDNQRAQDSIVRLNTVAAFELYGLG